jgi:hypothetical protein
MKLNFNPAKYGKETRGQAGYDSSNAKIGPIPEGFYTATIDAASVKTWDDGGVSVQLTWKIDTMPHAGRLVWMTLNLKHTSKSKELKSKYMLADVCEAIHHQGPLTLSETEAPVELIGKRCDVEIIVLNAQPPKYPNPKNYIKSVRARMSDDESRMRHHQLEVEASDDARRREEFDDDDVPF